MEHLMILTILCAASIPLAVSQEGRNGDLRLVGHGASRFSGRLEIFYNGEWGTVCAAADENGKFSDFGYQAGSVACRQMGLGNVVDVYNVHYLPELKSRYGDGSGPIFLDKVQCEGHESHLLRCNYREPFGQVSSSCSHTTEVAITCSNVTTPYYGEVRLRSLSPSTPEQGLVELYSNAQWAPICGNENTAGHVANVTCKQLGYTHVVNFSLNNVSGSHWDVATLVCTGSETCLKDCLPSLPTNMATSGCAAIRLHCGFDTTLTSSMPSGNFHSCRGEPTNHEKAVRINVSDPDSSFESPSGVVEIFIGGAWGPVCFEGTSIMEADVVCKQLGYSAADSHSFDWFYEPDNQSMYNLSCTGLELNIKDCTVTAGECSFGFMVAECSNILPPYGSLALRDGFGTSGSRGTLLVYTGEYFHPVCESNFGETHGEVACRQLGYNSLKERHLTTSYIAKDYPKKLNSTLMTEGSCSNQTQYLLSCLSPLPLQTSVPGCREGLDEVVISCDGGGPEMNVRLVGPKAPMSGRLEIYIQDQWGSACLSNSNGEKKFGYLEASVVCRSLDFKRAARNPYDLERPDGVKTHLESVVCSGFEESIFDCHHMSGGDNCSISVGIECSNSLDVPDGELRLYGNDSIVNETDGLGRLEISYHGIWMTVCGTYFSPEAAQVACRQLGYTTVVDICRNSSCYGEGEGYIHVAEDMCSGEENRLLDCNREPFTSRLCDHSLDVGLQCARYISSTPTFTMPGPVSPPPFPSLYIYIIIAVSAFLLVVGFVIIVCCCACCCVHKQKKDRKEGTWISPNQRNGRAAFSSGSSGTAANTYVQTSIRNNLHLSDNELSKKARDQYDDPSDIVQAGESEPKIMATLSKQPNSPTMPSKRDSSLLSSNLDEPASPVAEISATSSSSVPRRRQQHHNVYQNVTEIRCTVEEPPPNYDELDDFPPVHHNYQIPNSFSATNALSDQDEELVGEGSGFAECTMDSGIGSTTHEVDIKRDLQLPPLSPDNHETML